MYILFVFYLCISERNPQSCCFLIFILNFLFINAVFFLLLLVSNFPFVGFLFIPFSNLYIGVCKLRLLLCI